MYVYIYWIHVNSLIKSLPCPANKTIYSNKTVKYFIKAISWSQTILFQLGYATVCVCMHVCICIIIKILTYQVLCVGINESLQCSIYIDAEVN